MSGYSKEYYSNYCGMEYGDEEQWSPLFQRFADHIVQDFAPKNVLDIGCAFGYMVKYLRERGVEAWGIDTSTYAISQADDKIQPYLRVASACEDLPKDMPQHYDMVINVEVIEHMTMEDGAKALDKMCTYADTILFSSTGEDYDDPTHINVQQPEFWAKQFAERGFYKNLQYDMEYLSKYAFAFHKKEKNNNEIVFGYERALRHEKSCYAKEQITSSRLALDIETVREQRATDEKYFRKEIDRLTGEVKTNIEALKCANQELDAKQVKLDAKQTELDEKKAELDEIQTQMTASEEKLAAQQKETAEAQSQLESVTKAYESVHAEKNALHASCVQLQAELDNIMHSRGYRFLCRYYRLRDRLLPKGSMRRKLVKKMSYILVKKQKQNAEETALVPEAEQNSRFYTLEEEARQDWCRAHPLDMSVVFSIVVPVFRTPTSVLQDMIFSVKDQIYPHWELCILNASPECSEIRDLVQQLSADCDKIKYREVKENKGISGNTIEALKMAHGDYIALLDHDDLIAPNALYEYAAALVENPEIEFFYSDKDMIDEAGVNRLNPLYKPDYSPEIMYSANYLTHFCVIKKETLEKTEGFDQRADGAQDWDIFLKIMEQTTNFKHIDQILYHWRILSTSVASGAAAKPYALDAQIYSLTQFIKSRGWKGKVAFQDKEKSWIKVEWDFKENPSIAVISNETVSGNTIVFDENCSIISMADENWERKLQQCKADVLVFADLACIHKVSAGILQELASWAMHPEIAFVAPQLRTANNIVSCGLVYEDGCIMDMFGGKPIGFYGQMGHSLWYRNFSAFRGTCVAIERKKFEKHCEVSPDLKYFDVTHNCFSILHKGLRNVYDPFAWVQVDAQQLPKENVLSQEFAAVCKQHDVMDVDPYFNRNCTIDVNRVKLTKAQPQNNTDNAPLDKYASDALALASMCDFTKEDIDENAKIVNTIYTGEIKSMVWFLQEFDYVFYAGLYTIFRTASYLQRKHGIEHTFVFVANTPAKVMMERIGAGFPELKNCRAYSITSSNELSKIPSADASICTLWTTAYYSLKFNKVKRKFYFIQDYEPLFYPAGSTYAQTEATYRFGFDGVANTEGLKMVYENEYGGRAVSLDPSVDTNIFYPNTHRQYKKKQFTVFFYGRPGHPRNGFELGVEALKCLKRKMGNKVRIVTAGANYNTSLYGLDGVVENLGRLQIEETGDLYRNCDAGLVMMYTRHPSYLPYEMMACGCCVVSNYNAYTTWFLKDGKNSVVCEPSASSIAEAIENILLDEERRKQIGENGAKQIIDNNPDWEDSLEKVSKFILGIH